MPMTFGGPALAAILQSNYLERVIRDPLFASLMFRREAKREPFEGKIGETKTKSRRGLMVPSLTPLVPGVDPTPQTYSTEQWTVAPAQYGNAEDTHMPTSRGVISSKFLQDVAALGLNAGESLDLTVRNRLYSAYLAGNTNATIAAPIGAFVIHVASLNGFTDQLLNGQLLPVSAANPIPITFGGAEPTRNVIAQLPDNPALPLGPGWITLSAALTVGVAAREAVLANDRSLVYRVGGGASVDALGAADILTLQDFVNAVALLRQSSVPVHPDGAYHAHLDTIAESQIFADNAWQRLHDSLPNDPEYREFKIARKLGVDYMSNVRCPTSTNTANLGALISTGPGASFMSPELGADVINNLNVQVGRVIITGDGVMTEDYIDEGDFMTEAGVQGVVKMGNWSVSNQYAQLDLEGIRYILRGPQDRMAQMVGHAWSLSADWGVPSDILARNGTARRRRAIVLEFARG